MRTRRKAREAALQALYQCDTLVDFSPTQVAEFYVHFFQDESEKNDNLSFSKQLALGVCEYFGILDSELNNSSHHWNTKRMGRVDRNILRLAVYELALLPDIPKSVSINEAIELAKRFGSDESPMFINGVLDKVAQELEGEGASRVLAFIESLQVKALAQRA